MTTTALPTSLRTSPGHRVPAHASKSQESYASQLWPREADMLPGVLQHRSTLAPGTGWRAFFEVPGPSGGIVDLVWVRFSQAALAKRSIRDDVIPDLTAIRVMHALGKGVPAAELSAYTGVSRGHLMRSAIPRLRAAEWIQQDGREWRPVRRFRPVVTHVITVELKRDNWRTALKQAARHRSASDASWVVLDARRSGAASAAELPFTHAGIGLCGLSLKSRNSAGSVSTLEILHPARKNHSVDLAGRAFFGEHCLSLVRQGSQSGPERLVFGRRA